MVISIVLKSILICLFLVLGVQKIFGHPMQVEIFKNLQLPQWFRLVTGWVQLVGVIFLIIGFWEEWMTIIGGIWLGVTMFFAFLAHSRVKDTFGKSVPALVFLIIAIVLVISTYAKM
ncbi:MULTISPECIES: DoxX family protein [Gracilibacillus]|uniref:DoxX family membrane protein n=1 Tax=Gracilibacillus dipsosauri TaxID=178340 RepID=A0A317KY41_9BACI|nr:DoxX family protein [Gracilibacillus dipsosauri]PWU68407.1 DoxX family membrane protein [Gracilibacillus dipsosauri]